VRGVGGAGVAKDLTQRRGGAGDAEGRGGTLFPEDFTQRRGGAGDAEGRGK
jgi:hypothetical protein